jgi:hypothetical protein
MHEGAVAIHGEDLTGYGVSGEHGSFEECRQEAHASRKCMSATERRFELMVWPKTVALVRLPTDAALPSWATVGKFVSVTRTSDELSVVCDEEQIPEGVRAEKGWRILQVKGPFELTEIGILAALATSLADAKVSLFAISTFDTDYLLVSEKQLAAAIAALSGAGHRVRKDCSAS